MRTKTEAAGISRIPSLKRIHKAKTKEINKSENKVQVVWSRSILPSNTSPSIL